MKRQILSVSGKLLLAAAIGMLGLWVLSAGAAPESPGAEKWPRPTGQELVKAEKVVQLGLEIVREIVDRFQPLEKMPPAERLAEADRLWQQAERLSGQEKLEKQLEAAEEYLFALPNTNQWTTLKIENRLQTLWLSGRCRLQNCFSGLVLGVRESQTHPGADVIQWDTPEHVKLKNAVSGLYIDAPWKEKGWLPVLAEPKNSPSQLWRLLP